MEKLNNYKTEKRLASFSECVNQLVVLGLQKTSQNVFALSDFSSEFSTPISSELTEILAVKKMLAENLTWTLESRLLTRYLVENMPNQPKEINVEILKKFKTKAQEFVQKMVPGHVSVLSGTHLK